MSTLRAREDIRARDRWFFDQRAYPGSRIPPGALLAARRQMRRLPTFGPSTAGGAAAIVPVPWTSIGPRPISGLGQGCCPGLPPWSGRVNDIATHPTDSRIAYIATATGGVWKTTDSGGHWTPLFDAQPSLAMGAVAVDPLNPQTVYAGTGEGNYSIDSYYGAGVFKSTNGGASWTKLGGTTFDSCHVSDIRVKPNESNVVLVAIAGGGVPGGMFCSTGVWRSTDGGTSWSQRVIAGSARDLVVDLADPKTWMVAVDNTGFWRSTNSGLSWGTFGTAGFPSSDVGRIDVAMAPSDGQRLYAAVERASTRDLLGVYTSGDQGANWTPLPADTAFCNLGVRQCFYDMTLAVDPASSSIVYAGGTLLYRYTTFGASYTTISDGTGPLHADMHALAFDAAGRLWVGNDGGVYRSGDGGQSFRNLNDTLAITQFYPGVSGSLDVLLTAGSQDNGTERYDGSLQWTKIGGGDGGMTAVDPDDALHGFQEAQFLGLYRTLDGWGSFAPVTNGIGAEPKPFIGTLVMDPSDPRKLYTGTDRMYRTTDDAANWVLYSPQFAGFVTAIGPSPTDPLTTYAGTGSGELEVTTDGGGVWTNTRPNGLPNRVMTDIAVDPTDAGDAYVTVSGFGSGHVFHTTNAGGTWQGIAPLTRFPDTPTNAVSLDTRSDPPIIYVGTDVGVIASGDLGSTWQNASSGGLPNVPVIDLMIDWAARRIVALTHGRGAFTAPLANLATPADVALGKVPAAYFAPTQLGLDYSLTVSNLSAVTASKVVVSDAVPSDATVVGVKTSRGTCAVAAAITCNLGRLSAGGSAVVRVRLSPAATGFLRNSARVQISGFDFRAGNDLSSALVTVQSKAGSFKAVAVDAGGFKPGRVSVGQGDGIEWSFQGADPETVIDRSGMGLFDSGSKKAGETFREAFIAAGTYGYQSALHPDTMTGEVVVPVLASPATGTTADTFDVTWSSEPAGSSGVVFDAQYRFRPAGSTKWGPWTSWFDGTTVPAGSFSPGAAGSYQFRSRVRDTATATAIG